MRVPTNLVDIEEMDVRGRTPGTKLFNYTRANLDGAQPDGAMREYRLMTPANDQRESPFRVEAIRTIDEYLRGVSAAIGHAVTRVRLDLNRWDERLGINLVSVGITPLDGEKNLPIDFAKMGDVKGPTLGLMPGRLPREHQGESRDRVVVKVGFRPDKGCVEALRGLTQGFRGEIIKLFEPIDDPAEPLDFCMPPTLELGDTSLVANNSQRVVVATPCFDLEKLKRSGLSFQVVSDDALSSPLPDQAYFCRYKKA